MSMSVHNTCSFINFVMTDIAEAEILPMRLVLAQFAAVNYLLWKFTYNAYCQAAVKFFL